MGRGAPRRAGEGRRHRRGPRRQKEAEKLGILPEQGKSDIGSVFEDVYADMPWHIAEQRDQALDEAKS